MRHAESNGKQLLEISRRLAGRYAGEVGRMARPRKEQRPGCGVRPIGAVAEGSGRPVCWSHLANSYSGWEGENHSVSHQFRSPHDPETSPICYGNLVARGGSQLGQKQIPGFLMPTAYGLFCCLHCSCATASCLLLPSRFCSYPRGVCGFQSPVPVQIHATTSRAKDVLAGSLPFLLAARRTGKQL